MSGKQSEAAVANRRRVTAMGEMEEALRRKDATIERMEARDQARMAEFDTMLRRSEAMRNHQVDIINRLLKGGTIPEEMTMLQTELAEAMVHEENLRKHLETRSAELDVARSRIAHLELQMVNNMEGAQ